MSCTDLSFFFGSLSLGVNWLFVISRFHPSMTYSSILVSMGTEFGISVTNLMVKGT